MEVFPAALTAKKEIGGEIFGLNRRIRWNRIWEICIKIHKPDRLKVKSVLESVNYLELNLTALNQLLIEDEVMCCCLGSSSNFEFYNLRLKDVYRKTTDYDQLKPSFKVKHLNHVDE